MCQNRKQGCENKKGTVKDGGGDSKVLESMDEKLGVIATATKEKVEVWEDAEFYYKKKGSKITKQESDE